LSDALKSAEDLAHPLLGQPATQELIPKIEEAAATTTTTTTTSSSSSSQVLQNSEI